MVLGDIVVEQQASIIAYLLIGRMKILLVSIFISHSPCY